MEKLTGIIIHKLPFKLIKKGDLITFNTPLLSHFCDEENRNYLLYWVDSNKKVNRWILFQIDGFNLIDYFKGKKSLKSLIQSKQYEIVYFVEFDNEIDIDKIILSKKTRIPTNYLPDKDSYYNENISTEYSEELKNEILDFHSKYKLKDIKVELRNFNSHIDDFDFFSKLNNRNIVNSYIEIKQLRSSYLPLLILNQHLSKKSETIRALLYKHNNAYTNPLVFDSFFYELNEFLFIQMNIHHKGRKFLSSDEQIKESLSRLNEITIQLISKNPKKFKKEIELWRFWLDSDDDEVSKDVSTMLEEISSS